MRILVTVLLQTLLLFPLLAQSTEEGNTGKYIESLLIPVLIAVIGYLLKMFYEVITEKSRRQRELLEETGYCGNNAEIIGSVSPNPAIMSNRCHFLLVREVEKTGEVSFDPNEELVTELVSVSDLKDLIRRGKITHSLAMNAIFQLLLELGKTP